MKQLVALSPFLAFAFAGRLVGPTEGLIAGTLAATVLILRDEWSLHRQAKLADILVALLFYALVVRSIIFGIEDSIPQTRLYVDLGLTLAITASLMLRRPLSLQHVREWVAKELWDSPEFIRANYAISMIWAAALAVITVIDIAARVEDLPLAAPMAANAVVIALAILMTRQVAGRPALKLGAG